MNRHGYTLIELVISISLLVIVLLGGTAIFFRSLRSSGISDMQSLVNNNLRSLDAMIQNVLRYSTVIRLVGTTGDFSRTQCLSAGSNGVTGQTLTVRDGMGGTAVYSRGVNTDNIGFISSNSGVVISTPEIDVTKLEFVWYCRSGVNDKLKLVIEASVKTKSDEKTSGKIEKDINLLNSGIY